MNKNPIREEQVAEEEAAIESYADAMRRVAEIAAHQPELSTKKLELVLRTSIDQIKRQAADAQRLLAGQFTAQKIANGEELRLFLHQHGINRSPIFPDRLVTTAIMVAAWLAEGYGSATMLLADGKVPDAITAYSYGLTFSSINIAAGLFLGYWPLRHLFLKHHDAMPVATLRRRARVAFYGGVAALAGLIFSASRVRATGDHTGVFNFSEVGVLAGLNDSMTLTILAIGVIGTCVSILEGFRGIDDPIPGFNAVWKKGYLDANKPAEAFVDEVLETLSDSYSDALDANDDFIAEQSAFEDREAQIGDCREQLLEHNLSVQMLEHRSKQRAADDAYIQSRPSLIQTEFPKLYIPVTETIDSLAITRPKDVTTPLVAELEAVYQEATAQLDAALLSFLNTDSYRPDDPDLPGDLSNHPLQVVKNNAA